MQLSDLQTRVQLEVPTSVATTVINGYLNEAYKKLAKIVRPVRDDTSLSTIASQRLYTCPADCYKVLQVRLTLANGNIIELQPSNRRSIDWPNNTGQPLYWYPAGNLVSASAFAQQIGLEPVPTSAYAGLTITISEEYVPADMVGLTDTPAAIPAEYHPLLTHYADAMLAVTDNPELASSHMALWTQGYNALEAQFAEDQDAVYVAPRDVLPYPGRVLY